MTSSSCWITSCLCLSAETPKPALCSHSASLQPLLSLSPESCTRKKETIELVRYVTCDLFNRMLRSEFWIKICKVPNFSWQYCLWSVYYRLSAKAMLFWLNYSDFTHSHHTAPRCRLKTIFCKCKQTNKQVFKDTVWLWITLVGAYVGVADCERPLVVIFMKSNSARDWSADQRGSA